MFLVETTIRIARPAVEVFEFVADTHQGMVACDTETCRWQIQTSTGVETVHPIWFIHQAYGLS